MFLRSIVLLGLVLTSATACSTITDARSLPTVRVTNAMCDVGHCATLEIRAFIWKFNVPQWPDGMEVLGDVGPGETCLTFPAKWTLTVIGPDTTGRVDTATVVWTPADTIPIFLIAVDSAVFYGGRSPGDTSVYDHLVPGSVGETPNFSPGTAHGWTAAFPNVQKLGAQWSVTPQAGDACKP